LGSSIINVSGVVGVVTAGLPQTVYTASKAGLLGSPGYLDRSVDLIPARRPGEAAEIVAVIVFLASDGSSLVMLCGSWRAIAMVRPPSMGTVTPVTYPAAPAPSAGRNLRYPGPTGRPGQLAGRLVQPRVVLARRRSRADRGHRPR
jgi:hypothetical protein